MCEADDFPYFFFILILKIGTERERGTRTNDDGQNEGYPRQIIFLLYLHICPQ